MRKVYPIAILLISISMLILGSYLVMSAGSSLGMEKSGNVFSLFNSHIVKVVIGITAMIVFSFIPYEIWKRFGWFLLISAVVMLIATLVFGARTKGATRFLSISSFSFQPTDFAKFAVILFLAGYLDKYKEYVEELREGFIFPLILVSIPAVLIIAQPNVSNSLLIMVIGLLMLFFAGSKIKYISVLAAGVAFVGGFATLYFSHVRHRVLSHFQALFFGGDYKPQAAQAIIGLGSGGISGRGIGESKQRHLFLPEAYGDFIYAILGEETGLLGTVTVLIAYFGLFIIGLLIAKNCKDKFGQLLAIGISISLFLSALVNIGVTTGILPTTGIPLPLISLGGTSLIITCVEIGILINIGFKGFILNVKSENEPLKNLKEGGSFAV